MSSLILEKGRYRARLADGAADLAAAQRLRHLCFIEQAGGRPRPDGRDSDAFDARCRHLMIEETQSRRLVACCRLLILENGAAIGDSYSAQYYGLEPLAGYDRPMVEIGRFCVHPDVTQADVLRLAWGALARCVEEAGAGLMFGCSSFAGTREDPYLDAFALLQERHLAPRGWLPRVKAPRVLRFADRLRGRAGDRRLGLMRMPPLLRSYLAMGGWVSDHAVIDDDLNTLHVFTGVETGKVPAGRARLLRAVAGG